MKKTAALIAAAMLLASCTQNDFEDVLFRTTDDPFYDVPDADSLSLEHTIYLAWQKDDACDSFRLMKSYDKAALSFSCVYEGTETSYTDTDLDDGGRYVYRLDKTRGKKSFPGEDYAYGYSSGCRKDSCEPNDVEENATFLEYDLVCSLPCVRYLTNSHEVLDCDWFCIEIPPRRAADIVISQSGLENTTEGAATNLKMQVAGSESVPVAQKTANAINNTSYETKKFFFKIFPEKTSLFPEETSSAVIEYTVSLNQIRNYSL